MSRSGGAERFGTAIDQSAQGRVERLQFGRLGARCAELLLRDGVAVQQHVGQHGVPFAECEEALEHGRGHADRRDDRGAPLERLQRLLARVELRQHGGQQRVPQGVLVGREVFVGGAAQQAARFAQVAVPDVQQRFPEEVADQRDLTAILERGEVAIDLARRGRRCRAPPRAA